ncbi:hypothetical protein A2U01_0071092, partial [Trifolium medium]|nr:hypothetical protein [Trifolium medium]
VAAPRAGIAAPRAGLCFRAGCLFWFLRCAQVCAAPHADPFV